MERNKKKLERWIKDLLYEENAHTGCCIEILAEEIVEAVYNWLEEEGEQCLDGVKNQSVGLVVMENA